MKKVSWQLVLGSLLIILSTIIYFSHYLIFKDAHHIFIYLLGDIAFVPIEVLLVTLIIHRLLSEWEKRALHKKLNMVIGAFFSEVGTPLLSSLSEFNPNTESISNDLIVTNIWSKDDFKKMLKRYQNFKHTIEHQRGDWKSLQKFLIEKRDFLLGLLENPNLLEHESFTELLWAVFHLSEELANRADVTNLIKTDYEHLANDASRAYTLLITEWLNYMKHLQVAYPYLYSLAMRTNPFDPNASIEIK